MKVIAPDQLSEYIWINGDLIAWEDAKVHILTHSLHYSGAVFEGERAYNGKVFKLEEHTERLIASAGAIKLQVPYNFDEIIKAHQLIMQKNNIQDAYIRPLVWRGSESLNIINKNLSVNLMIATISLPVKSVSTLNLYVSPWQKLHPQSISPQCKSSAHYGMMSLIQTEGEILGYDDAILLDYRGYIAECTTSNIFFVEKDLLITPKPTNFLNGITRQTIIELAKKLGIDVEETDIRLADVVKFDECFTTGTAIEVKGVNTIALGPKKITFEKNKITTLLKQEGLSD